MTFVRLVLFFLVLAFVAAIFRLPGLEFLATDAAKWVILAGIIVCLVKVLGLSKK
jgi:hypothetical protein